MTSLTFPPPAEPDYADNEVLGVGGPVQSVSVSKDSGFETDQDLEEPLERARVIYPYLPSANDELLLEVGNIVTIYVKNEDGWFEGTFGDKRGLFPGNYVEPI
eukprot:sb/3478225/